MHAIKVKENISLRNYSPAFTADMGEYKGKRITLLNFDNQARNTTNWDYLSEDKTISYSYDSYSVIHNYFWHSFDKALKSIGMTVSNQSEPDPHGPAMWMSLKSLNDARFEVEVKIQKYIHSVSFTKMYIVTGEDIKPEDRIPKNLEAHAYRLTNKLYETILTDPEFKAAFFKAAAELGKPQSR